MEKQGHGWTQTTGAAAWVQGHVFHGDNLLNLRELLFQLNQENPDH
jgi:hypothetical protein